MNLGKLEKQALFVFVTFWQTAAVHPPTPQSRPVKAPVGPVVPTPEQMGKIRSELDIVNGNIAVMSEMLTEMTPGQEEAGDLQLLQVNSLRLLWM